MAKAVPLDKVLLANVEYQTEKREVLIIKKIGTNSTTIGTLKIDRKPTTQVHALIAPMYKTTSNFLGPMDLGALYNVVLPEQKIIFEGASGSKVRLIGTKIQLEPAEAVEAGLVARADAQHKDYVTVVEGTYTHGVDATWASDVEREILALTPKTTQEYHFNGVVMASVANVSGGVAPGEWYVRFYVENAPLEHVYGAYIKHGLDVLSLPRPPAEATELVAFSLADFPIILLGDKTLSVRIANVSGVTKSPPAGASITATFTAAARFIVKT